MSEVIVSQENEIFINVAFSMGILFEEIMCVWRGVGCGELQRESCG
jgi:hypothetical protein